MKVNYCYPVMTLQETLENIKNTASSELSSLSSKSDLEAWEIRFLGRKGELAIALKDLPNLTLDEKKIVGPLANTIKAELHALVEIQKAKLAPVTKTQSVDVTLPVYPSVGHLHPITQIEREVREIFIRLGFSVYRGPELEEAKYNFDALNFPKDHPARDMQDTFWVSAGAKEKQGEYVMRTHTSPGQVRYMKKHKPPLRIIIPGKVYRNEATDATHEHTFHQFECLMVDAAPKVSIATFKYLAEVFFKEFFGKKVNVRLRPSFFPFTEPSFEFDISCMICSDPNKKKKEETCSTCKGTRWIEIGGAGMVHQSVFEASGYPKGKYQGFAWGFGLTRLALMKYGITDIRLLMNADTRFLKQF